jgi:hypothetical protein
VTQFLREASLRIRIRNADFTFREPPIFISGLRVSFSILKSLAWTTNTAIIKIWNLSQNHRNEIINYGDEVTLYAGYQRGAGKQVLFIGDTTCVQHVYDLPEIVTILECGDGERYINQYRYTRSWAPNTPARVIIEDIAKAMDISIAEYAASPNLVHFNGLECSGMAKDSLTKVCNYLNLQWSIQNNELQVIPNDGTIIQPPFEINASTGMQGIPQRFTYKRVDLWRPTSNQPLASPLAPARAPSQPVGYKVNVALNPLILPGNSVILTSTHLGFKSPMRVENIRHEGDTFGFLWSSSLELTLLPGATL